MNFGFTTKAIKEFRREYNILIRTGLARITKIISSTNENNNKQHCKNLQNIKANQKVSLVGNDYGCIAQTSYELVNQESTWQIVQTTT